MVTYLPKTRFAFPGAEGFGGYISGGRGGEVYHVTTLQDNNKPGSLRYAVNQKGVRTIVFDISGVISLKSPLVIKNGDLTLAGQSAPGIGICIKNYPVVINADNIIIRYLRFRLGDVSNNYALSVENRRGIMIDHCSISWATRHNVNLAGNVLMTMQWCIISEALSATKFGDNGKGARLGGLSASFHHNLFVSNAKNNPYFVENKLKSKSAFQIVDFRNNVIVNWRDGSSEGYIRGAFNIVNNYYKFGPATSLQTRGQIIRLFPEDYQLLPPPKRPFIFVDGNYVYNNPLNTNDNWMAVYPSKSYITEHKNPVLSWRSFFHAPVTLHTAERAYINVLKYAGASKQRDDVDKRLVSSVITDSYAYSNGMLTSPSQGGGYKYGVYKGLKDTDGDGIPDYWEKAKGLDPKKRIDGQLRSKIDNEYTNLEMYLNSLVADITRKQNSSARPSKDLFWLSMLKFVNYVKREEQ